MDPNPIVPEEGDIIIDLNDPRPINDVIFRIGWRNRPRNHETYTQAHKEFALQLRRQGMTYMDIALRVGNFCSPSTVRIWCVRAGINVIRGRRIPQRIRRRVRIIVHH